MRRGEDVIRYDGKAFTHFTTEDGLLSTYVHAINRAPDGHIWLGMWNGGEGLSRYDGVGFINYTSHDGMQSMAVKNLYWDTDGVLWVATGGTAEWSERGGVSR